MMKTLLIACCWCCLISLPLVASAQKRHTTEWESGLLDRKTKVGVWDYYGRTPSKRQVLVQRYDHTTQKLLYFRPISEVQYNAELPPGQWKRRLVDQPPLFIGGDAALANYTSQLAYPPDAQSKNLQGRVVVVFAIDTLGKVSIPRVLERLGPSCDEEALRVARLIPNQWIPARIGSHAVRVEYELPFTFRLSQAQ